MSLPLVSRSAFESLRAEVAALRDEIADLRGKLRSPRAPAPPLSPSQQRSQFSDVRMVSERMPDGSIRTVFLRLPDGQDNIE